MAEATWHALKSPTEQWAVMPSFLIGEYLFIACALVALAHALLRPAPARWQHLLVWVGALVAGTANDVIFMALPLVDNFWQAQATIMLTPRLPLYIPCVYVWFMYVPTVAVWRLGLPPAARAALAGLSAIVVYAPYDIVGAKFLWWTWHDTDGPIANRLLGVPIGSTMWVITFVATFSWLVGRTVDRHPTLSPKRFLLGLLAVASLTTVIMVLQLTVLQQLDGGVPGIRGLIVLSTAYAAIAAGGLRRRGAVAPRRLDRMLFAAITTYFVVLVTCVAVFAPERHQSTSVHQTVGACHVEATDITGMTRYAYLCVSDFDEDFSFACVAEPPADGSRWYTVCGRPHVDFTLWLAAVLSLALLGVSGYGFILSRAR